LETQVRSGVDTNAPAPAEPQRGIAYGRHASFWNSVPDNVRAEAAEAEAHASGNGEEEVDYDAAESSEGAKDDD
jgi:hypothetical protein